MFDDRIVHQYMVNNPNDDELVRQLWSRSEDCVIPHRYYYSRPNKQTPEEFAAWAIENLRINVPMEVLAHGDQVTVVGDGRGRQKFCVQGIIKALKPGKTYEHNQTENQTHLSQENHRNLPARRIY